MVFGELLKFGVSAVVGRRTSPSDKKASLSLEPVKRSWFKQELANERAESANVTFTYSLASL
eukprot:128513-Amphidinium_carterae.1